VLLWPITAAAQLPDVNQIADDVESFGFVVAQKIKRAAALPPRVPRCTSDIHAARTRRILPDSS
jgi:hypothetical protein